jgi:hypothetical protein
MVHTCAIITGEPNEFAREIHTRMPVILKEKHHRGRPAEGVADFFVQIVLKATTLKSLRPSN